MRILLLTCVLLLSLLATGQELRFHGIITDLESGETVIGVHVQNISQKKLAISNAKGAFILPSEMGDSVLITHVGFDPQVFIMDGRLLAEAQIIRLTPSITSLAEVEVNIFPEYWRFKQMIIDTQPVDSSLQFDLPKVAYSKHMTTSSQQLEEPLLAPTIGIPFDLGGLTKKGKERKKLQLLLRQQYMKDLAYRKFSREWVADATNLSGNELTDFIEYCDFSIEYLNKTPLIDIHKEMMALLQQFKKERPDEGNQKDQYTPGA